MAASEVVASYKKLGLVEEAFRSLKVEAFVLRKIVSGGQTGADRAGLDFAIEAGIEHGGFVPRGLESVSFAVESDSKAFES
jgi:hypothetical protein